jgi:hypothetical protein
MEIDEEDIVESEESGDDETDLEEVRKLKVCAEYRILVIH